jgi:flagellar basal body-associated protein FliL
MKNKKKIIISIVSVILVLAIIGASIALYVFRYSKDKNDTEELFRQNVATVGYENTIETAYPTTDVYNIINEHFKSE